MKSQEPGPQLPVGTPNSPETRSPDRAWFGEGVTSKSEVSLLPWLVAGLVVLLLVGLLLLAGRHRTTLPDRAREDDSYASNLVFSGLQMSESTSLSGGKSTYIDGRVRNAGGQTVSGATLQVMFANDEALPAQNLTIPLTLIRSREPYVDTQPLAAAPLEPGSEREFRLIFEGIGANWNQQIPQMRVTHVYVPCNPCR